MKIYNKLVRDKIPQIIEESGKKFDIHFAEEEEYKALLEEKLEEEVSEFRTAKNLEELADILEVLVGLAEGLGYTEWELFKMRDEKKEQRGGFEERIVLERVYEGD